MTNLVSPGVSVNVFHSNEYFPPIYNRDAKGIYVASRASIPERSAMWREHRDHGWNIISTWIDEAGEGETDSFEDLWIRIRNEIYRCEYFILYAEKDDFPLKGALVETGMALAFDKPIIVVLNFEPEGRTFRPIGSWITHPSVHRAETVQQALDMTYGITTHPMFRPWEESEPIKRDMDEDIRLWAEQLAKDSVECGEAEYGESYPQKQLKS